MLTQLKHVSSSQKAKVGSHGFQTSLHNLGQLIVELACRATGTAMLKCHDLITGVANGKCETARLAFFFASPRHFDFLDCETETSKCLTPSYKKRDCETHITAQKTRLRDPWNSTKILRDPEFLKNHSPPLITGDLTNLKGFKIANLNVNSPMKRID